MFDGTNITPNIDGVAGTGAAAFTNSITAIYMGADASSPWTGPMCALAVIPSAVSAGNLTTIHNNLAARWF